MINWTEVVSTSMFSFIGVHIFLFVGFATGFYVQLHTDCNGLHCDNEPDTSINNGTTGNAEGDEAGNVFSQTIILPLKILAMFVGELEFGDHPFKRYPFNFVVFALFVYLVVIVMMNLLTGMALMDVQVKAHTLI